MAIIWVHAPFYVDDINHPKFKVWLDNNWHIQLKWILVEIHNHKLYVDGELANFENLEKLIEEGRKARWITKIAIFENEEDKVKFILRWL